MDNTNTNNPRGRSAVLKLFREELSARHFAESEGPNDSTLLWFVVGGRTVIVQCYAGNDGWQEYVAGPHIKVDATIAALKLLKAERVG